MRKTRTIVTIVLILFAIVATACILVTSFYRAAPISDKFYEGDIISKEDFNVRHTVFDIEIPDKYIDQDENVIAEGETGEFPLYVFGVFPVEGEYNVIQKIGVRIELDKEDLYEGDTLSASDFKAFLTYADDTEEEITVLDIVDYGENMVIPHDAVELALNTTEGIGQYTLNPISCVSFECKVSDKLQPAGRPYDIRKDFVGTVKYEDGLVVDVFADDVVFDWKSGSKVLQHGDNDFRVHYKNMSCNGRVLALARPIVQSETFPMFYQDLDTTIEITQERYYDTDCYVAHVVTTDPLALKTTYSVNGLGYNEVMSRVSEYRNAALMINGVFDTHRCSAPIVREGRVVNRAGWPNNRLGQMLALNFDGHFYEMTKDYQTEMDENNLRSCWQFYNGFIIKDGERIIKKDEARHPRTFIGEVERNDGFLEYYLVVADGRFEHSIGLTHDMESDILFSKGCTIAYNLDGGGSSEMVFDGKIISHPSGGQERYDSDFIYVAMWEGTEAAEKPSA